MGDNTGRRLWEGNQYSEGEMGTSNEGRGTAVNGGAIRVVEGSTAAEGGRGSGRCTATAETKGATV